MAHERTAGRMSRGKKIVMIVGMVLVAMVVAAAVALAVYRDGNVHGEEREIQKALAAGFQEQQTQVDVSGGASEQAAAIINYVEGPDNGPDLLLVHGQTMAWEDYARVLPDLAQRYHVYAVDCFGHGESSHDPALYTCAAQGEALAAFMAQQVGGNYLVSGLSSGGIIAAWLAANDVDHVTACMLEDPPLFRVTPDAMQAAPDCFVWKDGFEVIHGYLQQNEIDDLAVYYTQHSYMLQMFGGLQPKITEWTQQQRAVDPQAHLVYEWVPRDWTRGLYYYDDFDPLFGNTFYEGTWLEGVDQADMLSQITCLTVYLKANEQFGQDGVLYAANSAEDAARVQELIPNCETTRIDSGHDIHYEHPTDFIAAVDNVAAKVETV